MSPHPNLLCCLSICENKARVCEVLSNVSILSFFLNIQYFDFEKRRAEKLEREEIF